MSAVGVEAQAIWDVYKTVALEQSVLWDIDAAVAQAVVSDGRCGPFELVTTDHLVEGNSRVSWTIKQNFAGRTPYTFQLQVGESGNPLADDWKDVGPALTNTYVALDPEKRTLGAQLTTHYRIRLTDANSNTYYSLPATVLGSLIFRDWLNAREMLRQQKLRLKQFAGVRGFLLKRKRSGEECTVCLDPDSNTVTDSACPVCKGTRFVAGYYRALPLTYADLTPQEFTEHRTGGPEGWSLPMIVQALFLGAPMLSSGDVWVDGESDARYYIETIKVSARVRGVPLLLEAKMSMFPLTAVEYRIPLEGT